MTHLERDTYGMYKTNSTTSSGRRLMGADTLIGDKVCNLQEEHLGDIKEIMLDVPGGKIAYAVLSSGGLFTIGEKLFAIPWDALKLDTENKRFTLDIAKERLDNAPGFPSDQWPDMADQTWETEVRTFYGSSTPNLSH